MNKQPQPIETMAVLALAALVLYLWLNHIYLLYAAILLLLTGIFLKPVSEFIHRNWMQLAHVLGKINGVILLGILFFLVLTPLSWVYRLFNKDHLKLKKGESDSYLTQRNHTFTGKDLERMW